MYQAIVAGIVSGLLAPIVVLWAQHKIVWKKQRTTEHKLAVFNDAVRALSLRAVDALDPELQARTAAAPVRRETEYRPETLELLESAKAMVRAFFSKEAHEAFCEAADKTRISLDTIPNQEFEGARVKAIQKMASEVGLITGGA